MNPLEKYPVIREYLYMLQWITNLITGIIGVVLTILGTSPLWFIITVAVFNFIWSYTGITAQQNTRAAE